MKILKYILLFSFGLTLLGIVSRTLLPFRGGNELIILGVLIMVILIPFYSIIAFVKKQNRIESVMMLISIPLIFGVLFRLMTWPFGNSMIIIGSQILLLISIPILIYSIIKKIKISESILFATIGFCSLTYCFKVLFWPGSKGLIISAFLTIATALFIILKKKDVFSISKAVLGIIILLFSLSFITKESKLFQTSHIDISNQESNHPEDYYNYAWMLYCEGDTKKAKTNLQYAINELNNPNNAYSNILSNNHENHLKVYKKAMNMLENKNWDTLEWIDESMEIKN
ncbi:tetratricopeptide repeat protein [Aquimarina sp. 2201CG14-23]|uniref:tetratricopeptide repeat protein n=1 Tax=Aquimarina mycalae TaxID=3040073 RepID=UPI002477CD25|nr:hypothetical protein [Aquimarina sp. 2201CG14-23]MDH7447813.1 hypothetical protein [Aquimarina sp. 2201CG14-23]